MIPIVHPGGRLRDGLEAGCVAGVISGVPSTLYAVLTGGDPFEASLAAGSILLGDESRPARLLGAGLVVHSALSIGWGLVLTSILPPRRKVVWGALAGVAIAALDLGIGRSFARVRRLAVGPQVADHIAFGAAVGAVLARRAADEAVSSVGAPRR